MLPGVVTEKIGYNAAGLPVSRDQGDRHFMLSYDNHNRLLQESYRYGSGSSIVLTERCYDSYPPVNGLGFVAATGYASAYDSRVVGLQTYEKERILSGNSVSEPGLSGRYIERCFYYDSKGRLIQRVEKNHLGGVSRYHYAYDFVGNVTSECETHTVGGVTTNLEKVNNYDHVSRLLGCKVYLNGVYKGKVDYEYDALGRLSVRRYGENAATETLSYDIRGRLTEQGSSFFRLGLRYENAQKGQGLYGGDISEWSCRYGSKAEQLYTFSYDGAGRFTGGNHYENGVLVNKYVEQGIGYDKNGNILSLKRYSNGVLVDNLTYSYNGNSLSGLTESAVVASGDIYERKNVSGGSYDYDIYGNLSKDSRKNLNFEYNILNLLHNVREGSIIMAGYEYSYGGVKLKVWDSDGNGYAYVGNLVYRVTGSSFVFESGLFGEGVVSGNGICYHLKDHLGSIRAIVDGSGRLLEENDYYAFGHRHPRSEHAQSSANRFKYNGKELQTVGGLGYLDYGARMYDQSLGRWFTTDPLSEKYYGLSPYVYCGNNPINAVDLCGDSITTVVNATITNPDGTTSLQRTRYYYGQNSNGTYGFIDNNGNLYSGTNTFVNSLTTALNNLRMGGNVGNTLVSDLVSSTKNVQIAQGKNTADLNGAYIKWNPNSTTGGMNQIGTENRPAYIGLGHEMAHIQDCWRGTIDNTTWVTVGGTAIPNAEKYATHIENQLRAENDIPLRTHYGIDASSGRRVGLESTRIIKGNLSLFYNQSNGASLMGVPLLYIPFFYRKK